MIITGGENVYSKEVEDAIFENPAIADAVIIGVPHVEWGETVMAVVVLKEGQSLTLEELRAFLKPRIADYKSPGSWRWWMPCPETYRARCSNTRCGISTRNSGGIEKQAAGLPVRRLNRQTGQLT